LGAIVGMHYGAWALVSLIVLIAAGIWVMARSNKPILWLPFAGGGLVAAPNRLSDPRSACAQITDLPN
jgi:hypothetical protein